MFSQLVRNGSEELRKTQMKEKGSERTEEAAITALLCLEYRSLELADVLLQDKKYAYWNFQQSVLRLKKYKPRPVRAMLPTIKSTSSNYGITGVSYHRHDIDDKQNIATSRRYNINYKSEM